MSEYYPFFIEIQNIFITDVNKEQKNSRALPPIADGMAHHGSIDSCHGEDQISLAFWL